MEEPKVVEKEVQVDALEQAIKDAQDAKQSDIKASAQKSYDDTYSQEMKKVELEVIKSFGEKLDARQIELEKETKVYWRAQGNVEALIRKWFPEDSNTAIAIAIAESHLNPEALNSKDSHKGCTGSYGIFQIGCLHEKDPSVLYDVEYNVKRAREIYDANGWQPWGAYTDGSYLAYIR